MRSGPRSSGRRSTRFDRAVARVLVVAVATMNTLPAMAGNEFDDANHASFDDSVVQLDNSQAGQTTFTIDTDRTTIRWDDLQQPGNNTLEFDFNQGGPDSSVLNISRSMNAIHLDGRVLSNGTVAFANRAGVFIGSEAVIDVAGLVAIAGDISQDAFELGGPLEIPLSGSVSNAGLIRAEGNIALLGRIVQNAGEIRSQDGHALLVAGQSAQLDDWDALTREFLEPQNFFGLLAPGQIENSGRIDAANAALFAGRIVNQGEIEIDDGTLLMVAADAVYVSEFDNPVLIRLPHLDASRPSASGTDGETRYGIENHGTIDAGLGHVRLAASDPLGFGIRQGTAGTIAARKIEIEGGENGRVQLSGRIDADDFTKQGVGGEIDVTGEIIALVDAEVSASGTRGGGTIQIGGEERGQGELQRARSVIIDADTTVRANAKKRGDGGRVVVFSEELTAVAGRLAARGGTKGGDGGFVETSGLLHFSVDQMPNLSAPKGDAGHWLIDPYNITIGATPPSCPPTGTACGNLDAAIEAIIAPNFDSTGFDGVLRTVAPDPNVAGDENFVSADLIERALGIGIDVSISTQVFGEDTSSDPAAGDITIQEAISIDASATRAGTLATLTLLAAGDILVDSAIEIVTGGGASNLALSIVLQANDAGQDTDPDFDPDLDLVGDVLINADIRTGGGSLTARGVSVVQSAGNTIDTDGGNVLMVSGSLGASGVPLVIERDRQDPSLSDATSSFDPRLEIAGTIDTRDFDESNENRTGGDIDLVSSSLNVSIPRGGDDPVDVITGQLTIADTAVLQSGGGAMSLTGGGIATDSTSTFAGNVDVGGSIDSRGGDVLIQANRRDPRDESGAFDVTYLDPSRGEGGVIDIDANISTGGGALTIGNASAQSIQIDGSFDTTSANSDENGLIGLTASDVSGIDASEDRYGSGEIVIGATTGASFATAGLSLTSRDITIGEATGANAVTVDLSGDSSAADFTSDDLIVLPSGATQEPEPLAVVGELNVEGVRQITFNANTQVTAEAIRIVAAAAPTQLNDDTLLGNERPGSETRLFFNGTNGVGDGRAEGVRFHTDVFEVAIGDGTTATDGFTTEDLGTPADPEDFALERQTRGSYTGLQLRDQSGSFRPEEVSIQQDADLTITSGAAVDAGQLDLAGAFGTAAIGSEGLRIQLEASDGLLAVEDAAGFNNTTAFADEDDDLGQSFVELNGGLVFPDNDGDPLIDSVRFGIGGQALGQGGTTAFDVNTLEVSTPSDLSVTQTIADSIASVRELVFEAGRQTGLDAVAEAGTLTIEAGISLLSDVRIALSAAASGFGDLVFEGTGTTLAADEIEFRAGAGSTSENSDNNSRPEIIGLQDNVTLRDASGGTFGDAASSATRFAYQQDAGIDAETDLPTLAQFGLTEGVGFRSEGDVEYAVRSDFGQIDLNDGDDGTNDAARFQNADLSLIGLQSGSTAAVQVASDFLFLGKRIELGGIGDFTFTQRLAGAFNRSGADASEAITLRAGVGGSGTLRFDRGSESSVIVKAPTVSLVVGDGFGGNTNSSINDQNAEFDLGGPVDSTPTFVYHVDDGGFSLDDLPGSGQFIGGSTGRPDILAIRNDAGTLELDDFEVTDTPLDLTDDPGRLILEAEIIDLSQRDGDDLDLTSNPNLNLRLRTNTLLLTASEGDDDAFGRADKAVVLAGPRVGDLQPITGDDADFDAESLLIEAFDTQSEQATVANLSELSEDPTGVNEFDLAAGRGPTAITIEQDGAALPANLLNRNAISGQFARTRFDDEDDAAIATSLEIDILLDTLTVAPENVNGSTVTLLANVEFDRDYAILFEAGNYVVESISARTPDSILVADGTSIEATDSLALSAALVDLLPDEETEEAFGTLDFAGPASGGTTRLAANQIVLSAGPSFTLSDPDTNDDDDDDRNEIPANLLPSMDLTGVAEIVLIGDSLGSSVLIQQSADFDLRERTGDVLTGFTADPGVGKWDLIELGSIQGILTLIGIEDFSDYTQALFGTTGAEGSVVVEMPDAAVSAAPFEDFEDEVRIASNDVTFSTDDAATSIDLATEKLRLVSGNLRTGFEEDDELYRLRDDEDVLDRPILRVIQQGDFTDSELPLPSQYFVTDTDGNLVQRTSLADLDIELETQGAGVTLTLDDDIRARVTDSNLTLRSAADVAISLNGSTLGFEEIEGYAALQLSSLDIQANAGNGSIRIDDFMIDGQPANLSIETTGDQRFAGNVVLAETLQTSGRDITFTGEIGQSGTPDAGLVVATRGQVRFQGDLGSASDPLDHLLVLFDTETTNTTPSALFERDPAAADPTQRVYTRGDILFAAGETEDFTLIERIESGLAGISDLAGFASLLDDLDLGRTRSVSIATIGKRDGDLLFESSDGFFGVSSGEKLAVAGSLTIDVDDDLAVIGDAAALDLQIVADAIGIVRRRPGVTRDRSGETQPDGGVAIVANMIDFGGVAPTTFGFGRAPIFGVPNPFDTADFPAYLQEVGVFEIKPNGNDLAARDFRFDTNDEALADSVRSVRPTGASRSDLSGANGPVVLPTPERRMPEPPVLPRADRLLELDVETREISPEIQLARLRGAAVIDDLDLASDDESVIVTAARLDASDSEKAIELYERLFGAEGERAKEVRSVLQGALDSYLETTRARRVIGFELRRFVKNRPSTLLDAYSTLESLDALFRYHRRLGLSPGEFRRIQRGWLRQIQPDGITLDELSEAIHPSRYVRGSDILDIFGR